MLLLFVAYLGSSRWFTGIEDAFVLCYLLMLAGTVALHKARDIEQFGDPTRNRLAQKVGPKVLVIGGAGYIGSVLCRRLLEHGYEVRVLDRLLFGEEPIRELLGRSRFEFIRGDFRDAATVGGSLRGIGAVIHLGGIVGDHACSIDQEMTKQTNYAATALIAQRCKRSGVSRLLYASTCSVYGVNEEVVNETSAANPVSLYGASKLGSENILLASRGETFHPTVLRLGTIFGWSPRPRFDLVVNLLAAKAFFEKKVVIYNKAQWRPFVHVTDICRAFQSALEAPLEKVSGEVFNVGSDGMNHRLGEVGEAIRRIDRRLRVTHESNLDVRNYRVSFEKIRTALGYECSVSLADGVRQILQRLKAGTIADYTAAAYCNHKVIAGNDGTPGGQGPAAGPSGGRFRGCPSDSRNLATTA